MEYKVFIMSILNDLYLIREDVKEGPGHDAISALINKIESRPMETIEQGKGTTSKSPLASAQSEVAIDVSKTDLDGVYVYQFKK